MQIQDKRRRPDEVDTRSEKTSIGRTFAKTSLDVDTDVFAQVFEAIATTPSPKHGSTTSDVSHVEKSSTGEANELKPLEDEQDEELDDKGVVANVAALPYPVQTVAVESEPATETSLSENDEVPAKLIRENAVTDFAESKEPLSPNVEPEFADEGTSSELTIKEPAARDDLPSEVDEAKQNLINAENSDAKTLTEDSSKLNQSIERQDSTEKRKTTTDTAVSPSINPSEINEDKRSLTIDESTASPNATTLADETLVDGEKQIDSTSGASTDSGRDRRDRSESRFNDSRQDAINAPKDKNAFRPEQPTAVTSENLTSSSDNNGLASASTQSSSPPLVSTIQPTTSTALAASAGIVAVSGTPLTTSSQGSAATTDVLSISSGTGGKDSISEAPPSSSTSKSRQTELADRARLVHRITKAFQKMGTDGGHVRLKMHPDELGGVQLEMQVKGRTVTATVTADNEQARQVIQASLADLRQRLESQGLIIERLDVQTKAESGNPESWNQNPQQSGAGFRDDTNPRDGAWRRQDELRSGRDESRASRVRVERTTLVPNLAEKHGVAWLSDRGLDVQL